MIAYEFYWLNSKRDCQILGVLPERRKHPERLARESITHWGEKFFGKNLNPEDIFFIQIMIDDATGRIFRPNPFYTPWEEISK